MYIKSVLRLYDNSVYKFQQQLSGFFDGEFERVIFFEEFISRTEEVLSL